MEQAKQVNQKKAKKWHEEEVKKLISAFEAKPDLWDAYRDNYYSRSIKKKLLQEIGVELGVNYQEVVHKLHSLRTEFIREYCRAEKAKTCGPSKKTYSKWHLMSSFQFLFENPEPAASISLNSSSIEIDSSSSSSNGERARIWTSEPSDQHLEGSDVLNCKKRRFQSSQRKANEKADDGENDHGEVPPTTIDQKWDVWDVFGQFVASELRQVADSSVQTFMKKEIMKILLDADH